MGSQTSVQRVEVQAPPVKKDRVSAITAFFNPEVIAEAIEESSFTPAIEQDLLLEIAQDTSNSVFGRLAAIRMLRGIYREALMTSGYLQKLTGHATKTVGGVDYDVEQQGFRLLEQADASPLVPQGEEDYGDEEPDVDAGPGLHVDIEFDADGETVESTVGSESRQARRDEEEVKDAPEGDAEYNEARTGHFPPESKAAGISGRAAREGCG